MTSRTIVWFRDDLRIGDNPALHEAVNRGEPIVAVFVLDEHTPGIRPLGAASRWWLHHSLAALTRDLNHLGISLVLRKGAAGEVIRELVTETDADAVYWNRRYALPERDIDARLKSDLRDAGLAVRSFDANLLFEPWTV
ncbi:deoxyribodipyrimidine photo-lyase, partial [Microbacterium sp. UBA837]